MLENNQKIEIIKDNNDNKNIFNKGLIKRNFLLLKKHSKTFKTTDNREFDC